jgi:DNA replication initiation complex subunit (GINS family)
MVKDDQYKQIFQLWKSERRTNKLLEVKGSLYSAIRQRISSLEKELESIDSKDVASMKIISERTERLKRILRDLAKIRKHKIIHAIINEDLNKSGLAAEEMDLVKNLESIFDAHNNRSILGEAGLDISKEFDSAVGQENDTDLMTVRILKDIPEIIATTAQDKSKQSIGPFKKEDIVQIPLVYAKTLIMKNAADRVDLPEL